MKTAATMQPPAAKLALVITTGLLAVSFASIFIRWCDAPALVIAAYRISLASLVLWIVGGRKLLRVAATLSRREWQLGLLSGVALAVHFASWIRSLELTTVAISVVLVATSPFFVAIGARLFLGTRISKRFTLGLVIAFVGTVFIAYRDFFAGNDSFSGDLLAVLGAIGGAGYILCGRALRARLDNFSYISLAYTIAAIVLLLLVAAMRLAVPGYAVETYGLFVLIALVPQLIGHSSFNWLLRYLSAPVVAILLLGEPVLASILAFILLHEEPATLQIIGSVLVLIGVLLATQAESRAPAELN